MTPLASIPEPGLRTLLNALKDEILFQTRVSVPGIIKSFDAAKQTATVAVAFKALVYNQPQATNGQLQLTPAVIDYPVLVDVPVFTHFGGKGCLTFPVSAGDTCLVVFSDRAIDGWFSTGATVPPTSSRMHDLSDGFAIVGIRPATNPVASFDTDGAALRYDDTKLKLKSGGAQVLANADFTATSANGGVVAAKAKIDLHNATTDAKTVLQAVITALTSLNSVKSGGDASAAITAASTQVNNLFQ
jgi:hypothetical protein